MVVLPLRVNHARLRVPVEHHKDAHRGQGSHDHADPPPRPHGEDAKRRPAQGLERSPHARNAAVAANAVVCQVLESFCLFRAARKRRRAGGGVGGGGGGQRGQVVVSVVSNARWPRKIGVFVRVRRFQRRVKNGDEANRPQNEAPMRGGVQ